MDKVYLVTVMNDHDERCWGWLPTFKEAEDACPVSAISVEEV